ncbi:MAG TPA: helix-turn-helix domain-containing protein [Terriglobales bacterium]|nr:helix-turn-helix domain-containing protein [Terriglobales bacterium]
MSTTQSLPVAKLPFPAPQSDILTVEEAAAFLHMTKRQVWEMTRTRGQQRMPIPIPMMRINGNIRFRRSSLEQWIDELEQYERTGKLPSHKKQ